MQNQQVGTMEVSEVRIEGLVVLDTLWFCRKTFSLSSYSLNALGEKFLDGDNVKLDLSPAELFRACAGAATAEEAAAHGSAAQWQRARLVDVAKYCLQDVDLLRRLCSRIKMVETLEQYAAATITPVQEYVFSGEQIKIFHLLMTYAEKMGFWVNRDDLPAAPESYVGATVLDPTCALFVDPIVTLDFASLYPSVMCAYNLSFDTVGCKGDRLLRPADMGLREDQCTRVDVGDDAVWFVRADVRRGIVPEILLELWRNRNDAKKKMKAASDPFEKMLWDCYQKAVKVT